MKILLGDCRDIIRSLEPASFDTVIADPPYGVNYKYAMGPSTVNASHEIGTAIANDKQPYVWWLQDAFNATKVGGALICFCATTTQEDFRRCIELAGYKIQSQVIWDKAMPGLGNLSCQFGPQHEVIWFATKGRYKFTRGRPKSILRHTRVNGGSFHPHEKPVSLLRELLRYVTPEGGKVLDPFAGSASAGIAAREEGLDYTGIEIDEKWFEVAEERLKVA